ncbi:MAG: ribonuclease E activity regulator RraA [Gammaproteobacteria bacterium]|nr:ribonuclease E activity regulator RraA [Gammaproteobacteria bacterium]
MTTEAPRTLTADLCDAYETAYVIPGPFFPYGGKEACLGPVEVIATENDNSLVARTLKEPGLGRILFVDNSGSTDCAMVGGDLARAAHDNGWQGIVVHGAIRDTVELRQVPIAIYARGTCPRKSVKRGIGTLGKPASLDEAVVHRDDFVAADLDGVVLVSGADFKGL